MFNLKILENEVQNFVQEHLYHNLAELSLKDSPFEGIKTAELMNQIQAKLKCKKKLPKWFKTMQILYPNKLNIEQSSSELTANYKNKLIKGESLVDITGGFGVDSYYFSKKIKRIIHCEIDVGLSKIASHNFKNLKATNIETVAKDGILFLYDSILGFDWIYIDPSRRDEAKNKRFFIKDCHPNVAQHLDLFFKRSNNVLVKLSPMLDIKAALRSLPNTKEVHVVAIKNEVKELLFVLEKGFSKEVSIEAINLNTLQPNFKFKFREENKALVNYQNPFKYLYEPNLAILKSGAFKTVALRFEVKKLGPHTHLYTSIKRIENFPGNTYRINENLPFKKAKIKKRLKGIKGNLKTRNYPQTVAQIKKELNIIDGGNQYIFFTSSETEKQVLLCSKLNPTKV
tara:strand:+ start:1012 stop:2208 length:1197 start_codon:yes stop_codon:yes gene_type:complete